MRCGDCKHWRGERIENPAEWSGYLDEDDRPAHGRLDWAECSAAPEGWADDIDWGKQRMAVWDGSQYLAQLLTHKDHGCLLFEPNTEQ